MAKEGDKIRFGILGCAEISRKVSRAIQLSPKAIVYAVASRSLEKARQFAIQNNLSDNINLYGDYTELLEDPLVDAVYMPLPTSLHLQWAILAAKKHKHLLLEKPTALDVKALDEMLEACDSNGVQFMDASMWYHHPRTHKMKNFISNSGLLGLVKYIHSSSTYCGTSEFLENNIRVKPDMDALGALGDAGWYCIGAILWAMNKKLPTTVTALSTIARNGAGVILSCSASMHWENEQTVATFHCSFISHETMDLTIYGSHGTLSVEDLIIPYVETSAAFNFISGAKFVDLHIGWNVKHEEIKVDTQLPQETKMIEEFSRLVKGIKYEGLSPDVEWGHTSRVTQLVMDAVKRSIDTGFQSVNL